MWRRGGAAVGGVLLALAVVCWVGFGGSDTARTTLFEWDTRNDASRGERRVVRGVDADDPRFKVDALDAEDATPMMGTQEQGWYGNSLGVGKGTKLQGGFAMQPSGGEGEMASDNGPIENFRVSILLRKNIQMAKSEEQLSGIQVQRDAVHQSLMHLEEKAASLLAKQRDIKGDLEVSFLLLFFAPCKSAPLLLALLGTMERRTGRHMLAVPNLDCRTKGKCDSVFPGISR